MLHLAFLLLAQAAAGEAAVLKPEIKDVAAQGDGRPSILCEGTTNLPNGARIEVYLYYGRLDDGPVIARTSFAVQDGKFSQAIQPYKSKNFPGKYGLRLVYNPELQDQRIAGFAYGVTNTSFRFGTDADFEREAKVFRGQLAADLQAMVDLGEEVKTQIDKLAGKPAADWAPFQKEWMEKSHEIMKRADPHKIQEYYALNIDHPATTGLENLSGILNSAARYAAGGRGKEALEGITVLRQTAQYLIGEMNAPKLTSAGQVIDVVDAAKKLIREAAGKPDQPVLPAKRKFLEMNALLQKSMPEEVQPTILEVGTRAAAFFNALADKEPNVKELQAELEKSLEKIAAPLRPPK
jgi:hypothetical protein